jgi:histone H3/H4
MIETVGRIDRQAVERFVRSPMFPAWVERQERIMTAAVERMNKALDAAIREILERGK